jgi:peptidoglycan/LPS O-acetylase OafA/YrhL
LFHTFILSVFVRLKFLGAHPVLFVGGALIGANLFGYLVYICVEKPILARLRRALLATTSATSTPVADGGPSRYRGERQGSLPSDGYGGTRTRSAQ